MTKRLEAQVTLTPEPHYIIKGTNGEIRARVVGEWEWFTKLETDKGDVAIVAMETGFAGGFFELLGKDREATILKASPTVLENLAPKRAA